VKQISRRRFLKTTSISIATSAIYPKALFAGTSSSKPNVVLVLVDDMGFSDLGCYGGEINTPNLDTLATNGLRFTQFYNAAKCAPTRVSLLTGCYYREVGKKKMENCITIPEVMRKSGYATLMTGKWGLGKDGFESTPVHRGFDRYFGHLSGWTNYFKGDKTFRLDDKPFVVPRDGFYTTDANTDYAIQFLAEAVKKKKPFFLYLSYNPPHAPLHAWPKDIEKYRGRFKKGWDLLRRERYQRQLRMKLIKPNWKLTLRDDQVPAWANLSEKERIKEDLKMAVYAAMVDRIDQNIGRLMEKLRSLGIADNTLFLFCSDNGGSPFQRTSTPKIPPGYADSHWTYDRGWAQLSNTPFRLYKRNQHEGGIATPFIAYWPKVIHPGSITDQPGHVIDIMATLIDISGTFYPDTHMGQKLRPLRGKSLLPIFVGDRREPHSEIFFQYKKYKAFRAGKYKITWDKGPWELYDMDADRTEMNNLAYKMPKKVSELVTKYDAFLKKLKD